MFLIFLCRVLKMIKAISVIVMLAMAPTVALAQASAPVKGSLKGVCYNMMTGEYTDGPCGTAGTSKVMTPDKIKEAGDLLRRRDALATIAGGAITAESPSPFPAAATCPNALRNRAAAGRGGPWALRRI